MGRGGICVCYHCYLEQGGEQKKNAKRKNNLILEAICQDAATRKEKWKCIIGDLNGRPCCYTKLKEEMDQGKWIDLGAKDWPSAKANLPT